MINTELLETENQPAEPLGNSFPASEFRMNLPEDSKMNQIDEDPEELGFSLETNYKIKEEIQVAFCTDLKQAQNVIDKQATDILQLKADLELAEEEIARKHLLEVDFEEFKKNAAVQQREKEEPEKEIVALKESVITRKNDWHSIELQINAENYGLKRALSQLGAVNERMLEKIESLKLSTRSEDDLAEQHEAATDNLQSTIVQLKRKLSSCQFQIDQLKKDEKFYLESSSKFELTASQFGKEIEDLRAEMKIQE
jgi:chromosome segregation ATPase